MRVLGVRLQLGEIDDVDHTDFQVGQMLSQNRNSGERLQRGHVADTSQYYVRLGSECWSLQQPIQVPVTPIRLGFARRGYVERLWQ